MRQFDSEAEVDTLTDMEAREIVHMAMLKVVELTATYGPYGLDDRGDYLAAAIDNYHRLFHAYWDNDGVAERVVKAVKEWLLDYEDWGGSDGEIRFDLWTERYQEEMYAREW